MGIIQLTQGKETIVDDDDVSRILKFASKWQLLRARTSYYASIARVISGKRIRLLMHRLILNAPDNMTVDHVDGNGLNNQKTNLRLATKAQNLSNRKANRGHRFKGVSQRNHGRYRARIGRKCLGGFGTEEEAAKAYDRAAIEKYGAFANLNFPPAAAK